MKIQNSIRFALAALAASVIFNTIAFGQKTAIANATGGNGNGSTVTHDATLTGNGTTASPLGVANSGVTTGTIADGAVNERKVADGAVTTNKIANGAVSTNNLRDGAITSSKLATTNAPQTGQVLGYNGTN